MTRRNALAAREAIEAQCPQVTITTPLTSRSGSWEAVINGTETRHDDFWLMAAHITATLGVIIPPGP